MLCQFLSQGAGAGFDQLGVSQDVQYSNAQPRRYLEKRQVAADASDFNRISVAQCGQEGCLHDITGN